MNNSTRKWIRGGIEILIHGGTAALIVGLMTYKKEMPWSEWREVVGASFLANGGLRFLQWWNNNPLPPAGDTTVFSPGQPAITGQPVISINPLSKVLPMPAPPEPPKP